MSTIRLTAAQAMVRYLSAQMTEDGERFIDGVWAIFGHGNVAGLGEALEQAGNALPTWRGQNEQTMAHAAIAYAKTKKRKRAHGGDLLHRPGRDQHGHRGGTRACEPAAGAADPRRCLREPRPDPVLQQIEDFDDGTVSVPMTRLKPVSRYFDRISRPEQMHDGAAARVGHDDRPGELRPGDAGLPARCTQAEAYDYPAESSSNRRSGASAGPSRMQTRDCRCGRSDQGRQRGPSSLCGGGVVYSRAEADLADFRKPPTASR